MTTIEYKAIVGVIPKEGLAELVPAGAQHVLAHLHGLREFSTRLGSREQAPGGGSREQGAAGRGRREQGEQGAEGSGSRGSRGSQGAGGSRGSREQREQGGAGSRRRQAAGGHISPAQPQGSLTPD